MKELKSYSKKNQGNFGGFVILMDIINISTFISSVYIYYICFVCMMNGGWKSYEMGSVNLFFVFTYFGSI